MAWWRAEEAVRFEAVQKRQQEGREISLLYAVSIHLSVLVAVESWLGVDAWSSLLGGGYLRTGVVCHGILVAGSFHTVSTVWPLRKPL